MEANAKVKKEVCNILDKYAEYYLKKDLDGLLSLFVTDHDLVAIGTGDDEWDVGLDELKKGFKRDLNQAEDIHLFYDHLTISASDGVAWISGIMTMHAMVNDEEVILHGRVTMVMVEKYNGWHICHIHYSMPAERQEKGKSYPGQ